MLDLPLDAFTHLDEGQSGAAHLFGTALMGGSAFNSVVKPSFETHDLSGLYLIDSSVFPTNLGVNPQHTISALAWLAAERLAA